MRSMAGVACRERAALTQVDVDCASLKGREMDLLSSSVKEPARSKEGTEAWPSTWPNLRCLLTSLDKNIVCLQIHREADGHKAIIRFKNSYGLEIFKYPAGDFFEMPVIRFPGNGLGTYEFAFGTPLPDLNLGYSDGNIIRLCSQVAELR